VPFHIEGGYVVGPGGEHKNKKPMTHARLLRYLAALEMNVPEARTKERYVADSMGHISRRGRKKAPAGINSFTHPPEIQTKAITDTLLGKHPEPHGTLRLRSMHGRYLGVVGKRRKLVAHLRRGVTLKAGYNPGQLRDAHGRWAVSGGAWGRFWHAGSHHVYTVANELYSMKRQPPKINLKTHYLITVNGVEVNGYYIPSSHTVGIATAGEHPGLTTAHEIGHAIDHRGLGSRWASGTAETKAWRKAVENTPEIRQWRQWQKQGYIEHNGNQYKVSKELFNYFLSDKELWARSFSQWHASRSHNGRLKSELRSMQHLYPPLQWSDSSFNSVNKEIDRLMRKNGYI